jgi:hypothetical protein
MSDFCQELTDSHQGCFYTVLFIWCSNPTRPTIKSRERTRSRPGRSLWPQSNLPRCRKRRRQQPAPNTTMNNAYASLRFDDLQSCDRHSTSNPAQAVSLRNARSETRAARPPSPPRSSVPIEAEPLEALLDRQIGPGSRRITPRRSNSSCRECLR